MHDAYATVYMWVDVVPDEVETGGFIPRVSHEEGCQGLAPQRKAETQQGSTAINQNDSQPAPLMVQAPDASFRVSSFYDQKSTVANLFVLHQVWHVRFFSL